MVVLISACAKKTNNSIGSWDVLGTWDLAITGTITTWALGSWMIDTGAIAELGGSSMSGKLASQEFQWVGTEPFRSFAFTGGTMVWSAPGDTWVVNTTYNQIDQMSVVGNALVYSDMASTVVIKIVSVQCSDGMSDTVYPKEVSVTIGTWIYTGCIR